MKNFKNLGDRLQWVARHIAILKITSIIAGIIGLGFVYFIDANCWFLLVPMGGISVFYVIPIIPSLNKNLTLREIPFLKIFLIGLVWTIVIIGIPMIDSQFINFDTHLSINLFFYSLFQVFCFVIGITIPFDIRDINYDKQDNLKTIPSVIGIKTSIFAAEIFLSLSIILLYILFAGTSRFYILLVGHIITMIMILYSNDKREELFFAGLIEGSVLILYLCILIADYLYFL